MDHRYIVFLSYSDCENKSLLSVITSFRIEKVRLELVENTLSTHGTNARFISAQINAHVYFFYWFSSLESGFDVLGEPNFKYFSSHVDLCIADLIKLIERNLDSISIGSRDRKQVSSKSFFRQLDT